MTTALVQSAAGGANTWFSISMQSVNSRAEEAFEGVAIGKFLEDNEEYYTATEPAAETAVLLSNHTLYYYLTRHKALTCETGSGKEENLIGDFAPARKPTRADLTACRTASAKVLNGEHNGCLDAFNYGHVPVRVLWDEHLIPAKLKGVKTLVLPNAACLSSDQIVAIRRFVEAGGGLVATFESGAYDESGNPAKRRDWLRFLGIERIEGAFVPSRVEDYLTIVGETLPRFPNGMVLPRPVNGLKVKPARDARTLALFNNPIGQAYLPPKGISNWPAVLLSKRGRGRVVYAAAALFESFNLFHIADHKNLARSLVQLAAGPAGLQVETSAPGALAIEARSQKGRLLIHLINATAEMKRPMERIVPLHDVELSVRARGVRRVRALRAQRTLPFSAAKGRVAIRVPEIAEYEVLLLE